MASKPIAKIVTAEMIPSEDNFGIEEITVQDQLDYLIESVNGMKKTVAIIQISESDWDVSNNAIKTVTNIPHLDNVDFGLPVPTTRGNASAVSEANIIITNVTATTITFNCVTKPTQDLFVCVRY